jgi:hypothetical protein
MSRKRSRVEPARRSQDLVGLLGRGQGARQEAFAEYWILPPDLSLAQRPPRMSVIGSGRAENICSFRVFLSLTHLGHEQIDFAAMHGMEF